MLCCGSGKRLLDSLSSVRDGGIMNSGGISELTTIKNRNVSLVMMLNLVCDSDSLTLLSLIHL